MKRYYVLILFLALFISGKAQLVPPEVNPLPTWTFERYDQTDYGHFSMCFFNRADPQYNSSLMLLDQEGYLAWYKQWESGHLLLDFRWHDNVKRFSYVKRYGTFDIRFFTMDSAFQWQDSVAAAYGQSDIHEYVMLDNGNRLVLALYDSVMDLSHLTFNSAPGSATTVVKGFSIQEVTSNGTLVWDWKSLPRIPPEENNPSYGYNPTRFDYAHPNAIDVDLDGNLLVSCRHTDAIYKIDRNTKDIIWRWGGTNSDFTFSDGLPFGGQHHIRVQDNGHYTLYDNGNFTTVPFTRAVEYDLNLQDSIAYLEWEYYGNPSVYAPSMGNFQRLSQGEVINWGDVFQPDPNLTVLDLNKEVAVEISLPDSFQMYRAHAAQLDFELPRPTLVCNGDASATLTAPAGHSRYLWSTGETTQSISISDTGIYQVWVDYGEGMLGSWPFFSVNPDDLCSVTDVAEESNSTHDPITAIYDLTGRTVTHPKAEQLYIIHHQSGRARKVRGHELLRDELP